MGHELDLSVPRVLTVDLDTRLIEVRARPELASAMGGAGLGTRLLAELVDPAADALSSRQPLVLAIGPLTAAFPVATKTAAFFKSPLTGNLGESHAGGRLAMAMRFSGYDAIVVVGASSRPVYLSIGSNDVSFKDATPLWGVPVEDTGRILRENEVRLGAGKRSIVRIGEAGERLVSYASVNVDTYRHFGRLGMGAVMGSKRLKAIVVGGDLSLRPPDPKRYSKIYNEVYRLAVKSPAMQKYHEVGTPQNVTPLNAICGLPTRNLQQACFDGVEEMSGEAFASQNLLRKYSCFGCPVGCIHIALLRQEFAPGYEYRYSGVGYDYELIFALGTLLGIGDRSQFLDLVETVEELGMDSMSCGAVLAWLTEARQKGLVPESELGVPLEFGDADAYQRAVHSLVRDGAEVWAVARRGTAALAARYGGEFDLELAGNEISGYHTGYGTLLGHAVGARHSHLDAAGYALDQQTPGAKAADLIDPLLKEERERCMLTSLHVCLFARKIYGDRALVREALGSLGLEWSDEALDELGASTLRLKHQMKKAMGFSFKDMRLPRRFFETPSASGSLDQAELRAAIEAYGDRVQQMLAS